MTDKLPDDILWHQSGVNSAGEPFVQLLRGTDIIAQMTVTEARDHGMAMLEAAEAAESDAFIFQWAVQCGATDPATAAALLVDFRKYRAEVTGKRHGATSPRDWVMPKQADGSDAA
jgi:hypothetical protein